jgi:hypothetical protein
MAWKGIEDWVFALGGADAWEKVKQAMNVDDHQRLFSKPLLPINWIDYRAYVQFTLTADAVCGQGDKKSLEVLGRTLAQRDLKGAYRMFLLMASPKSLIEHAPSLWNQYFNEGKLTLNWLDEKKVSLEVREFADMPLHHELIQGAFMAEAMAICGAKKLQRQHPRCLARKDECCCFEFEWA